MAQANTIGRISIGRTAADAYEIVAGEEEFTDGTFSWDPVNEPSASAEGFRSADPSPREGYSVTLNGRWTHRMAALLLPCGGKRYLRIDPIGEAAGRTFASMISFDVTDNIANDGLQTYSITGRSDGAISREAN